MSPAPRDWDKELAEIDKIIAKGPPPKPAEGGGAGPPARSPSAEARLPAGRASRRESWATWIRVLLGAGLGGAMTQWPYGHACGAGLFLYLGAAGVVGLAGLWGAVSSWRRRMGVAHIVSLLVALWGGVLVAAAVLPRVGYAARSATWWCP